MSTSPPTVLIFAALVTLGISACSSVEQGTSAPSPTHEQGGSTVPASATGTSSGSPAASTSPSLTSLSASPAASGEPRRPADTTTASSLTVLVNKQHPLTPLTYAPTDLVPFGPIMLRAEAATAADAMFADAAAAGVPMTAVSGYRSYETQQATYSNWVAQQGQDYADTASARPGYSEHQTGLALDIGDGGGCDLQPCFKDTSAANWVAENGYKYGFVVRYPWWQHETTGYWYEPWHLRYVGVEEAQALKDSGFETLEDFWGAGAAPTYSQ